MRPIAGIALVLFSIFAWKSFLFAGSGFAFIICAIIFFVGASLIFNK